MEFKFSEIGLGISIGLIFLSAIYTYVIRFLVISNESKTEDVSAIKISKQIIKLNKKSVFYKFKRTLFLFELNILKKEINFDEKMFLSNSIYCISNVTFLTYLYINSSKKLFWLSTFQKVISFVFFILILFFLTFNLMFIALAFFAFSFLFSAIVFVISFKRVKYSVDSTCEILKQYLNENQYYQSIKILKKFRFFYIDVFLNSGVSIVVDLAKKFKKWN